ncbi:MAG: alpha/beta fold hydrolase [Armatimonadota bacterium]|nr:alpha/beta fold hydrolase [Armatimonadota bacterium]MDR7528997.1 alpha/beta fold hydrolase [Armatimonadota bacterium]
MVDSRLRAAVDHWAPRFVAQGVDYNDFVRTTAPLQRWEQWLDAWVETARVHEDLARRAEERGRSRTAGEAYVRAALCYHFARFLWFVDMDRHHEAARRAVACLYAAHRHLDPTAERVDIPFERTTLAANLRRPPGAGRPPLVLLIPGLDSAKEEFFHWEEVFLSRGMATLSLDGPGQGESARHTRIRPDYEAAVAAALDALAGRDDLDLDRVGAAGVSLGGYYAPRAAAFEGRVTAVAAIGGPYDFGACWPQLPDLTREAFARYSGASGDDDARRRAGQLTLDGVLPRLSQPLLVVFGRQDRLIPHTHAERVAAEAPRATLVMYPEGNHVCNNIPYKYRPLVADWMAEQLRA